MSTVSRWARQAAGLFFDDGRLAVTVLVILDLTAILVYARLLAGPAAGVVMVCAIVAALLENVIRTARAAPSGG